MAHNKGGASVLGLLSLFLLNLSTKEGATVEFRPPEWFSLPEGPFEPTWESLSRYEVPDWFRDAKFGIFIHWGPYSVPAFGNEWYPRHMYVKGRPEFEHHIKTYGPQKEFGYKDFIPLFTAEKWEPREWARLFKRAGARYVVLTAEHHDGFALWDSALTRWCATKMGPRRDLVGELAEAVREEGLVFGVSYHRAEHWWFFDEGRKFDSDVNDPRYADLYGPAQPREAAEKGERPPDEEFLSDWLRRACELVDKYRPQLFWFDWWIEQPAFEPYLRLFAAYYYNRAAQWGLGVVINYKHQAFPERAAVLDVERGKLDDIRPLPWQTDTSVCLRSWGYIRDHEYKSPNALVDELVDIVSKNGNLLLNIGPKPDGTIPDEQREILLEIGDWLSVNGEAIYGTRPWRAFGEGPTRGEYEQFKEPKESPYTAEDVRFTTKGGALYAILLDWPKDGRATIRSLSTHLRLAVRPVRSVSLLGHEGELKWTQDERGLSVELPPSPPTKFAHALKVEFEG